MEETSSLLDVRGLSCPLPVLKANKALRALPPGARLTVLATDPAAVKDFAAYAEETGHTLLSSAAEEGGVFRFLLQRRAAP
jgi:tRNA 2-thiouridine synthesizing protein A